MISGISETTEREECLDLADRAGLDLKAICIQVVENIIAQPESMDESFRLPTGSDINDSQWMTFGTTTTDVSFFCVICLMHMPRLVLFKEDKEKLKAIEWLLFDPSLRYEAMFQANSLARMFLGMCRTTESTFLFGCNCLF